MIEILYFNFNNIKLKKLLLFIFIVFFYYYAMSQNYSLKFVGTTSEGVVINLYWFSEK